MKKALIVGYFTNDKGLIESYNEIANSLLSLDYDTLGLNLTRNPPEGYLFKLLFLCKKINLKIRIVDIIEVLSFFNIWNIYSVLVPMEKVTNDRLKSRLGRLLKLIKFQVLVYRYLRTQKFDLVILNHQFSGYQQIVLKLLKKNKIRFIFWHPGFLPETLCFDSGGQMAESDYSQHLLESEISYSENEVIAGEDYIKWIKGNSYSRPGKTKYKNEEAVNKIGELKKKYTKTILVIGANDYKTGCLPRSYENSDKHAPYISSSEHLFRLVSKYASKDTLVLYKPHPNLFVAEQSITKAEENVRILTKIDLASLLVLSDVSITIASSGAYESLLFGVPCAVLGRIPGSGNSIFQNINSDEELEEFTLDINHTTRDSDPYTRELKGFLGYSLRNYFYKSKGSMNSYVVKDCKDKLEELI